MFISEFYSKLMSQEGSRLFDALRRVSRLDTRALQASSTGGQEPGWVEWPPITDDPETLGLLFNKV